MQTVVWSREALIADLPKLCLHCRGRVRFAPRTLKRESRIHSTELVDYPVAICNNTSTCGRAYAQQPTDGARYGSGFRYGRLDVEFVSGLPYHLPLSQLGSKLFDSKPQNVLAARNIPHIGVATPV